MTPDLLARIDRMEAQRDALLQDLTTWAPDALTARPGPGRWSALEILEHLVVAEFEILAHLPDPTTLTPRHRKLKHRLRYGLVWLVLRLQIPVKVPSPSMAPAHGGDLAEWTRRWEATYAWLRSAMAARGETLRTEALFRHPVAGPITLAQALELDRLHLAVHRRQLQRIRAARA
jgi:hypothetical protein